ncbi:3-hydroxy acid dehydrogenase [Alicyclobacillus contaminans]|nr:3-hydroxy acid dehydrogenase [Alicyclobacillus contaminans]
MLSDGAAVEHVVFGESGAIHALSQGALIVNMSTVGVDETKQFALRAAEHQVEWMDAPVSGSVGPAEAGTLVVLAGGSESAFHRVKPLLATMAKSVHHLGPVGSGAAMKLLVNGMLAATVAAASECMALAEKSGLGRERFLDVLSETGMWSPILAGKRPLWLDDEYHPSFALKHMTKDLALLSRFAVQYSAALPGMTTALTTYLGAQAQDLGDADMAAVFQHLCALAGAEL